MNSPYAPPQSTFGNDEELPQKLGVVFWLVAIAATVLAIVLGIVGSFVVPAFEGVYGSFEAEIPLPTKLLIGSRVWLWLALIFAAVMWGYCWKSPSRYKRRFRMTLAFFSIGVISGSGLTFASWALYLPILKLGTAQ